MRDLPFSRRVAYESPEAPAGTLVLKRRTLVACAAFAGLAVSWAAATTWYIASRDELAQRFFALETEMKYAYEDRIGQLSGRLEREVTQNLVEKNAFEARIGAVASRQAEIEARQSWLRAVTERGGLVPDSFAGLARTPPDRPDSRPAAAADAKPAPLDDFGGLRLKGANEVGAGKPRDRLSAIEGSLRRVSAEEGIVVGALGRGAKARLAKLRAAFAAAGLAAEKVRAAPSGTGGPLVPVPPGSVPFAVAAGELDLTLDELGRLRDRARSVPFGTPLDGELDPTSPFGYRVDPFTRGAALHTGADFRAESGSPARATAAGRVTVAEYSGGYGNMVEVDHGGGLVTRYGHLSSFAVAPGERVSVGQIVGRTGSTGRSTGPHLHYETRMDGEPINPVRFLEAGRLLAREGI